MRSACPPIMYSCKYLNFSRGNSDMELLARRVIQALEGDEGHKHLDEYSDSSTERGQCLLKSICAKFGFDSLGYSSLDGVLEAIGIPVAYIGLIVAVDRLFDMGRTCLNITGDISCALCVTKWESKKAAQTAK